MQSVCIARKNGEFQGGSPAHRAATVNVRTQGAVQALVQFVCIARKNGGFRGHRLAGPRALPPRSVRALTAAETRT